MSYYESYGTRKVSPLGQWLNRYFARTISAVVNSFCAPNSTVVEIGSGNGLIAGELSQTHRYTCYEPSKILADHLRFIGLTVKEQFVPPLTETQESLDAVLAVHVVEHQVDYLHAAELFNSVHRVLKPGGIFLVVTPDFNDLGRDFYDADYSHNFVCTANRLIQLGRDAAFTVEKRSFVYGYFPLFPGLLLNWMAKIAFWIISPIRDNLIFENTGMSKLRFMFARTVLVVFRKNRNSPQTV